MITPARPEHWPDIRRICAATSYVPVADPEAFARRWTGPYERPGALSFVALVEGKVAGYVVGAAETPGAPAGYPAHLHVNVDPAFQGRGLGRALVERFVAECPAPVHVVCRAEPAPFYRSLGFVEVGRQNDLYVLGLARRRG